MRRWGANMKSVINAPNTKPVTMQEAFSVMEGGLLEGFLPFCIASAGWNSFPAGECTSAGVRPLSSRTKSGEVSSVIKTVGTVGCDKSVGGEDNSKDEGNEEISDSSYMGGGAVAIGLGHGDSSMDAEWENISSSGTTGEAGEITGVTRGGNEGSGGHRGLRFETLEKGRVGDAGGVIGVHVF